MDNRQKHSNAIAYLRQLCCSGLSKEMVIAEFLCAVQAVIPSGSNVFAGIDAQMNFTYHQPEFVIADLAEIIPTMIANHFTVEDKSHCMSVLTQHLTFAGICSFYKSFYQSDLYNLIYRPYDQHHDLWGLLMHSNQPIGILILHRPRQQKPFNQYEQTLLKQLLPYLAHAMQNYEEETSQYCESGLLGMMIMNTDGQIQYLSHEAKNLLVLACYPVLALHAQKVDVVAKLEQLCCNLHTIFQGKHAAPPSWMHTNTRGRFIFRAYWLNRLNHEPDALINMTIGHQEPLKLKILRPLQDLPLSPTQKEVTLLLAQGYSNGIIGEHLNIKLTTVKDHISKIFDKLDIEHREQLLPMLLALEDVRRKQIAF